MLQAGETLLAGGVVKIGKRFVQQQQFWCTQQGATDGHPLALAGGQLCRVVLQQFPQCQPAHHLLHARAAVGGAAAAGVLQVLFHIQVRKQAGILEHVRHAPQPGGYKQVRRQPVLFLKTDKAAGFRPPQARDAVQQGALAAAAGAVDGSDAAAGQLAIQLQPETVLAAAVKLQGQVVHARIRQLSRRSRR